MQEVTPELAVTFGLPTPTGVLVNSVERGGPADKAGLRVGASTVLVEHAGPPLPVLVADTRATVLFSVPTAYRLLLRQPDLESFDLGSLRCCVSAAGMAALAGVSGRGAGCGRGVASLLDTLVGNRRELSLPERVSGRMAE
jgi:acyl-CoA synthetase (AMP-forming)/AMP-acid ligase II